MNNVFSKLLWIFVAALVLAGCTTSPHREYSKTSVPFAALPNGNDPMDPNNPKKRMGTEHIPSGEGVIAFFERKRGHALNIITLSGGGQNGAFGAGFIKGWRKSGRRPEFDIVTGVSTGALLATHVFLGTPADDMVLEDIFTGVSSSDIYHDESLLRGILKLLFGSNAFYDTTPLKELLDKTISMEVLQRVAAAYDENRRIWVGTTNLDYDQTWVWNMGLIAKQGTPEALEMYKKVLRASAAPPIVFPPVEIEGHLFADGSVRQNIVVVGFAGTEVPTEPMHGPGNVYVLHNGKEVRKPQSIQNNALGIAGPVMNAMTTNSMDSMLSRAYFAALARGYRFHLTAIPDDVENGDNALAFEPKEMRAAFDAGYALAQQSDPWRHKPDVSRDIPSWAFEILGPRQ